MKNSKLTTYSHRSIARSIKKNQPGSRLSKKAIPLVYLDCILFLEQVLRQSYVDVSVNGCKTITKKQIEKYGKVCLCHNLNDNVYIQVIKFLTQRFFAIINLSLENVKRIQTIGLPSC